MNIRSRRAAMSRLLILVLLLAPVVATAHAVSQGDRVLPPQENVLHIAPLIRTLAGTTMIPKAGHYVFLAPCSPLAKGAADICKDPPGVDRAAAHRRINASALAFFRKTLASPHTESRVRHE